MISPSTEVLCTQPGHRWAQRQGPALPRGTAVAAVAGVAGPSHMAAGQPAWGVCGGLDPAARQKAPVGGAGGGNGQGCPLSPPQVAISRSTPGSSTRPQTSPVPPAWAQRCELPLAVPCPVFGVAAVLNNSEAGLRHLAQTWCRNPGSKEWRQGRRNQVDKAPVALTSRRDAAQPLIESSRAARTDKTHQ